MLKVLRRREMHLHRGMAVSLFSGWTAAGASWWFTECKVLSWKPGCQHLPTFPSTLAPPLWRDDSQSTMGRHSINPPSMSDAAVDDLSKLSNISVCSTRAAEPGWPLCCLELALLPVSFKWDYRGKDPNSNASTAFSTFNIRKLQSRPHVHAEARRARKDVIALLGGFQVLVLSAAPGLAEGCDAQESTP